MEEGGMNGGANNRRANYVTHTRNDGAMHHNKILDLVSEERARARYCTADRPVIGHYADSIMLGIIAGHPGEEKSDWWRARPGSLQQYLNSRADSLPLKNLRREKKRQREKKASVKEKTERERVESGRHNSAVFWKRGKNG